MMSPDDRAGEKAPAFLDDPMFWEAMRRRGDHAAELADQMLARELVTVDEDLDDEQGPAFLDDARFWEAVRQRGDHAAQLVDQMLPADSTADDDDVEVPSMLDLRQPWAEIVESWQVDVATHRRHDHRRPAQPGVVARSAVRGWISAPAGYAASVDQQMAVVNAYDPAVRARARRLLGRDGPTTVREVDMLCTETWVAVFRAPAPEEARQSPLAWILDVMQARYQAFGRQEILSTRSGSIAGPALWAPLADEGAEEELADMAPGEHYFDSVRGRLEVDQVRRMVHEGLPLPVAMDRLYRVRDWATERQLDTVEAEACIEIAKVLRHQGRLSPARRPAFHALRLGGRARDPRLMILANFELSMISSGLDDDRYIKRMIDLGAKNAPALHARVCYSQARSAWKVGNLLEAVGLLTRSLELYAEVGDTYGYARAEVRFGSYLRLAGVNEQAEEHLTNALTLARQERYRRVEGYALLRLGVLRRVEKYERHARPMMTGALKIFQEIGDIHGEAQALGSLARLDRQLRDFDKAIDYAQRCLALCQTFDVTGFPPNRISMATAIAYRRLWKCYRDAGQLPAAEARFEQAVERYKAIGDQFGQAITMALMAEVLVEQGRRGDGEMLAHDVMALRARTVHVLFSGTTEEDMDENPRRLFYPIASLARWTEGLEDAQASLSADERAAVKRTRETLYARRWSVREALRAEPVVARGVMDITEPAGRVAYL